MASLEDRAERADQPGLTPDDTTNSGSSEPPFRLFYTADFYNRYPGELVTLFVRITLNRAMPAPTLSLRLPEGLQLERYQTSASRNGSGPFHEVTGSGQILVWTLEDLRPGTCYEVQLIAKVAPTQKDRELESQVTLTGEGQAVRTEAYLIIVVSARGSYLQYLPALYEQDELVGRLLMFCESFWAPLEAQISNIHYYIDPGLAPPKLLPWLASWLDLELDEDWPEARRRELLRWAMKLNRQRGTQWSLQKYLEIYTGQKAEIVEHRFKDLVLDDEEARLDYGVALGPGNLPHTFSVTLRLPPLAIDDEVERTRREKIRQRTIESIIEMQKPAHTVYSLTLETLSPVEQIK